jgi:hypothetical protein
VEKGGDEMMRIFIIGIGVWGFILDISVLQLVAQQYFI